MAKGTVNKIILLGRLGQAPEIRQLPNGNAVANISLATNDGYKDKATGQYIDVTEWHRVVIFNKLAEVVQQYCQKGSQLYVEGRLRTNKWTDQNGQDRYTTEIVANEIQLMGGNTQGQSNPPIEAYVQNNIATPSHLPIGHSQYTQERQEWKESQQNQKLFQSKINDYAKAKGERQFKGNHQPNLADSNQMAGAMNDFHDDELPF